MSTVDDTITDLGLAFLNVFGKWKNQKHSPALVYYDNLGDAEDFVAETASHEVRLAKTRARCTKRRSWLFCLSIPDAILLGGPQHGSVS